MLNVIILAAGKGTRMKSNLSKVLHKVGGISMFEIILNLAKSLNAKKIITVASEENHSLISKLSSDCIVTQKERLGTGHAVMQGLSEIQSEGKTMILYADTPLITKETLEKMQNCEAEIVVLGFHASPETKYGRLLTEGDSVKEIVEFKDASASEKSITLCNSGIFLVKSSVLKDLVPKISNKNAAKEFYLTDIVKLASEAGFSSKFILCEEDEVLGVNDKIDLSNCEKNLQNKFRKTHMENGVSLIAPETVFFSFDTKISADVIIEPNVIFGKNVEIQSGSVIKAFSYIEDCKIGENVNIGPFARIRGTTLIGENAKIGNFVEIKNSNLKNGVKAGHLAYIGDVDIEEDVNVGAGVVFCNYDGRKKNRSTVSKNAFLGSNTSIVSPVEIGESAVIAAGSVITKNVPSGSLAIERGEQKIIHKYSKK
jgi:bifunctional UDP-N-acetylglucosamine pyrophosphorylase/glucosamine-1-phosphate N-acetyltransferase